MKTLPRLDQDYKAYTPEDFVVWKTLFNRQIPLLRQSASHHYLDALRR